MDYEEKYMYRCLQLATYGNGHVAPNPMVGAVVVHNDQIIGEGYHQRYGEAHAEPNAILAVKNQDFLQESTLYVNLEPCSHIGKTPPCANFIIDKKIRKVVVGSVDPNPKVSGRGIQLMRDAGIEVIVGVLEEACQALNKYFYTFQQEKRPYVLLKWAETQDGFIDIIRTNADTPPLQISNLIDKQLTHKLRSEMQAIMVSTNTAVLDNPSLTTKHWPGKNPIRIILDRTGRIPEDYNIFDNQAKTIIFTQLNKESTANNEFIQIEFNEDMLHQIIKILAEKNIHSILVEGGAQLLNSFIEQGLWDEATIEVSGQIVQKGIKAPNLNLQATHSYPLGNHWHHYFINSNKQFKV